MKFITIGEIMMRLSPPNYDKIVSTHDFIVNYGGAEANVAVSLACLGVDSTLFTVLPNTDLLHFHITAEGLLMQHLSQHISLGLL